MNGPSEKPSDDLKKDLGHITSEFTDISSTVGKNVKVFGEWL